MDALQPRLTGWIPHVPTERQHAALLCDEYREGLYGGAAGGGKSDFLLMAALQYADVPGYAAIILRRTFPQLALDDGLLQRAQAWLEPEGIAGFDTIGGLPTRYVFPSGATLAFRHCQHEKDRFNFQGGAYQFIGWDELTQFSEIIYRYLMSRLRRLEGSGVPLRVRGASNPGGVGHDWVCRRFVTGEALTEDELTPFYLPARLSDNPHLDQPEYRKSLANLLPYERAMLENGDWFAAKPGTIMDRAWFEVIEPEKVPPLIREVRRWDIAGTKASEQDSGGPAWTAGVHGGVTREGHFVIKHVDRFRENPDAVKRRQLQRAALDGPSVAIRQEQEPGSSGKAVIYDMRAALAGYDFKGIPSTGSKIDRARPFITAASDGRVSIVRSTWNEDFLREMEGIAIPPSGFMDQFDAAAGAYYDCTLGRGVTPADLYGPPPDEAAA